MGFFGKLFGGNAEAPESESTGGTVEPEITPEQLHMACAALLLEVAEADYKDDPAETQAVLRALESELGLKRATVTALLDQAKAETEGATDLFPYTHLINQRCTREQKCAMLTAMWRVAFADGDLDKYEEHLIRRTTELLRLDHSDFIRAKQAGRPKER
ncbi:MAG: TerB family tellurite resistance protein [Verrucomicrobia subdivision 3 bacterium]|nr:TerB family tellurite resistance protein [Limisphaerales bacterium]